MAEKTYTAEITFNVIIETDEDITADYVDISVSDFMADGGEQFINAYGPNLFDDELEVIGVGVDEWNVKVWDDAEHGVERELV